jgi:hypothetical protein
MARTVVKAALLSALALGPLGVAAEAPPAGPAAGSALGIECGGIGSDEAQRMRAEAGRHALMILFVAEDGSFLSEVGTRIDDPLADLRVEASCGPIGLVDVPAEGNYRITATYRGETREQWLALKPGGGATLSLRWKE